MFIDWIESNVGDTDTLNKLNLLFRKMRNSKNYSFKRHSMILQYEVLALGMADIGGRSQEVKDAIQIQSSLGSLEDV
jgi:hypothetical protein